MKRLREQASSPDRVIARAAALLTAMHPLDPSQIRRPPPPREANLRFHRLHLRVAFALALILASAVAGAATGPGSGWLRSFAAWALPSRPSPPAPPEPAAVARAAGADTALHSPAPPQVDAPQETPAAQSPPARAALPPPVRTSKSARTVAATSDESALVVDAVRALRREHDPRRARELAEEVLQRYPRGAQCEEAMAVAMEAATMGGDSATARRWAERYLEAFGAGRFADHARDVLAASPR
jgi:hypothetical protein